jgi:arylsulfatase A-like enzyme
MGGLVELSWANIVPSAGAPNVLLIITSDVGFGAPSTFGGVIPTPTLDQLAKSGLLYTQFHTEGASAATRAALLTGRAPASDGTKGHGYFTAWLGKDDNTPVSQVSRAGPFDRWPTGMGFQYFYGFLGSDVSQWQPRLHLGTTPIAPYAGHVGWNLTTAMADNAIQWLRQLDEINPHYPFFVYYAPSGAGAPHHPTPEWVKKIDEMHLFDRGWNDLREQVFANQKRLSVIPQEAQLARWPEEPKNWDTLSAEERRMFIRQAEVYAAYLAYTDAEIGRVIQSIADMGKLDNTLVIYLSGDRGGTTQGPSLGTPNTIASANNIAFAVADQLSSFYDAWGSDRTYPAMAAGWAAAFATPFAYGETLDGAVISWPARIKDTGGIRGQYHTLADIVPTVLQVTGINASDSVDGIAQTAVTGVSLAYTFDKANANAPSAHKRPSSASGQGRKQAMAHPAAQDTRTEYVYSGEVTAVPAAYAPNLLNTSYTITADVELRTDRANGILVKQGDRFGGYGFYLLNGRPIFFWSVGDFKPVRWEGSEALSPGKHKLVFSFKSDGTEAGAGGTGVLSVDGQEVSTAILPRTLAVTLGDARLDVGADTGAPVDGDYQAPFRFAGRISRLALTTDPQHR